MQTKRGRVEGEGENKATLDHEAMGVVAAIKRKTKCRHVIET